MRVNKLTKLEPYLRTPTCVLFYYSGGKLQPNLYGFMTHLLNITETNRLVRLVANWGSFRARLLKIPALITRICLNDDYRQAGLTGGYASGLVPLSQSQNNLAMVTEDDLIYSPLQQTYTVGKHKIEIQIYRMPHTAWALEVLDIYGNSTVWDEEFATDQAALDEVLRTIREEGIETLIGEPSSHAQEVPPEIESSPLRMATPLSEEELAELDSFLMSDVTSDETMALDTLDGYMTAIVIGPTMLSMSQWYSGIWGDKEEDTPHFATLEEAQHIMELIMRYYNGIIWSLQHDPDTHEPLFDIVTLEGDTREYLDGEMWAFGFMQGLELCQQDWKALFDDPRGRAWLNPIRLLGADDVTEDERALTQTPEQREEIVNRIPESVAAIYRFWLPYRQAIHELELAKTYRREHTKVGRNDPCPCGSGKKFKKCCGVAGTLH